jgi:hypothetical protein
MDEGEAALAQRMAAGSGGDIVFDSRTGVFGHKVSMLDFAPQDLERFRAIGRLVEFHDEPGVVETALALSGSAAQSKIQSYPGDCDYFERVNIRASTREEACDILARLMREKALATAKGPTYQLIEVKLGSFPEDMLHKGNPVKAGAPIAWQPEEIRLGRIEGFHADGTPAIVAWETAARDPGWCKLGRRRSGLRPAGQRQQYARRTGSASTAHHRSMGIDFYFRRSGPVDPGSSQARPSRFLRRYRTTSPAGER